MKTYDHERRVAHESMSMLDVAATTPHTTIDTPRRYLRRHDAAQYVRERWGLPCQPSWLAKLAVVGGGPVFRKCGRFPVYEAPELDDWARSRLSTPMCSTSESHP